MSSLILSENNINKKNEKIVFHNFEWRFKG